MGTLMKNGLDEAAVRRIAANLARNGQQFDADAFLASALPSLQDLELKSRVLHVARALHQGLPKPFTKAAEVLRRAAKSWDRGPENALAGFAAWPVIDYVGLFGLEDFEIAMQCLKELTHLFSAEFAIRPFIEADWGRALAILHTWVKDPDAHVRRLVSEGTRPRLPWSSQLAELRDDPSHALPLLTALRDDESLYVRRSVANHLNDIGKDHPDFLVELLGEWSPRAGRERNWVIRHAARTLLKQGKKEALSLLGFDPNAKVSCGPPRLEPAAVTIGDSIEFRCTIASESDTPLEVMVDYVVNYMKADGTRRPKVFKLKKTTLAPRARIDVFKRHRMAQTSTRKLYTGEHELWLQVNGRAFPKSCFTLGE